MEEVRQLQKGNVKRRPVNRNLEVDFAACTKDDVSEDNDTEEGEGNEEEGRFSAQGKGQRVQCACNVYL